MSNHLSRRAFVGTVLASAAGFAAAQSFPERPIRFIIPYAPGGASDAFSRAIGPKMGEILGQPVVIDNRAGANGYLGTYFVQSAPADGYTILLAAPFLSVAPLMDPQARFKASDFAAVASFVEAPPNVFVIPASLPVNTMQEFIAYAKARPGELNVAQTGAGGTNHLGLEAFMQATGTKFTYVPYKGTGPMLPDLISGRLHLALPPPNTVEGLVQTGRLKALAVNGPTRYEPLPKVPTVVEAGLPADVIALPWYGIVAPRATPSAVVARLNAAVNEALKTPEVRASLKGLQATITGGSAADFGKFLQTDERRWGALIKARNIRME